ncbi:MAG: sigma-70 family RNA polymerase sigma factor [Heliobacteriaceae bacterium]|nr:sigma-70 family RNA polymerase sigma factor [Heliobacteriaceae bacterium]
MTLADHRRLIEASQAGDTQAFSRLVELYQDQVYGLAVHLTGNLDDAQDLAQEAFVRAYRSVGSFRFQAEFGTWLHRITVNTWINMRRKHKGVQVESLDRVYYWDWETAAQREVAATDGNPVDAYEQLEFQGLVRDALAELTEEHRMVLVLREIYGYSYEEIADTTTTSLGTVKSRLSRAKANLRVQLLKVADRLGVEFPTGTTE